MIDTVVLTIPVTKENILDPRRFSPSASGLFKEPYYSSFIQCKLNPSKDQKDKGNYLPRLTLSSRMKNNVYQVFLRIEFSAPKILFGNNFEEIREEDFPKLISELKYKLFLMGIILLDNQLINAPVSSVHYCRNIPLQAYVSCSMVINQLEKAGNYNEWLDLDKTSFRNGGQILHMHSDRWEFVVYDKLRDLERAKLGKNRSVEEDNYSQLDMFKDKYPKQEILRLELRINTKQKLRALLTTIGDGKSLKNITFVNIFKREISQKLLRYYWGKIQMVTNLPENIKTNSNIIEISTAIRIKYPEMKDNDLMRLTYGIIFIQEYGTRAFRNFMQWNKDRGYKWNRFNKQLEKSSFLCNMNILSDIETKI